MADRERKPTVLQRAKGGRLPAQWAVLAVETVREKRADTDTVSTVTFGAATLIIHRRKRATAEHRKIVHVATLRQLWDALAMLAADGTLTWLFSYGVRDTAGACDFWQEVLDGRSTLSGDDPAAGDDESKARGRRRQGYCILEDPPSVIEFRMTKKGGRVKWVDVRNYGVESAEDLMAEYANGRRDQNGKAKRPGEWGWTLFERAQAVETFVVSLLAVVDVLDLGSLQATAASQSLHAYRHRFAKYPILLHRNTALAAFERTALYGGRCECRYLGRLVSTDILQINHDETRAGSRCRNAGGPIMHYDVASLYPSVARNAKIPAVFKGVATGVTLPEFVRLTEQYACVARVLVDVPEPCVPLRLDYRHGWYHRITDRQWDGTDKSIDTQTIYPTGRFWTTLCGPELALVWQEGEILACDKLAYYECYPLFTEWVDELWQSRVWYGQNGQVAMARVCKRLLNALFGKWAQRKRRWQAVREAFATEPFAQWWQVNGETDLPEQWRSLAWNVERMVDVGEAEESLPVITAWICSLGRATLWNLMRTAGLENVYYVDTDSIWTNTAGSGRLNAADTVAGVALGKLKLETVCDDVTYYGIKNYVADGRVVLAGVPKNHRVGDDGRIEGEITLPTASYLWRHERPGTDVATVRVPQARPYRHGIVQDDGSVRPWHVKDPEDVKEVATAPETP